MDDDYLAYCLSDPLQTNRDGTPTTQQDKLLHLIWAAELDTVTAAKLAGVSRSTMNAYRRGARRVPDRVIEVLHDHAWAYLKPMLDAYRRQMNAVSSISSN